MDRNAQFAPIQALLPQMLAAAVAADAKQDAINANIAETNRLRNVYIAAQQKADTERTAVAKAAAAVAQAAIEEADIKTAALMEASSAAVLAYRELWQQGSGLYQNLLQDGRSEAI